MGVKELCGTSQSQSLTYCLKPFVQEIMKLKFHEEPDYNKLRFLLEVVLLKQSIPPDRNFDWTPERKPKQVPAANAQPPLADPINDLQIEDIGSIQESFKSDEKASQISNESIESCKLKEEEMDEFAESESDSDEEDDDQI